jgi:hypothetical protein
MAKRKDCYTDEEKAEIIAHVLVQVATGRFVSRVFREDQTTPCGIAMPTVSTFWQWVFEDVTNELSDKLTRAREAGVEAKFDEAIDIAENPMPGEITTTERTGDKTKTKIVTEDMLGHRKLQVETIIKAVQLLKPRKYGPRLDVTSAGEKVGLAAELDAAVKREEERIKRGG